MDIGNGQIVYWPIHIYIKYIYQNTVFPPAPKYSTRGGGFF